MKAGGDTIGGNGSPRLKEEWLKLQSGRPEGEELPKVKARGNSLDKGDKTGSKNIDWDVGRLAGMSGLSYKG